ncbi:Carboxypeptidase regulatory-like domain-containing protein [Dyella sp. OK004]|nr:Carboxypeptidase regulatory-like domain-containing protein [Dyella sp. OK004]
MKGFERFKIGSHARRASFSRSVAMVTLGLCGVAAFTTAQAQGTTASIFGQAPAGATVTVSSVTGLHRHITVDAKGRYKLALPVSVYSVMLEKDGKTVDTRANIPLTVGRGMEIDFACPNDQCAVSEGG